MLSSEVVRRLLVPIEVAAGRVTVDREKCG
jgi:hypothetical protein